MARTYHYWYEERGLRKDRAIAKVKEVFFMSSHHMRYVVIPSITLTEEDILNIEPVVSLRPTAKFKCPTYLDPDQENKLIQFQEWLEKDITRKELHEKFRSL